ncbi:MULTISPECIES: hypothetical protein [unclassified Rhizobium]|uniref:hypothetical protein n=1 Tax=unclassified Rhizobium TaxID=2613769 RepID=UPI001ADCF0A1|nr:MULTISPECIES: hypothetical protein [unclassified Rhizobium]MBO9100327.1 hypothetical protein [Rhizobium sp. L58/93]MBO9186220.1 hypothetical protein [Rhizobium sp. E27B/91]QXZ83139.1 hypothetical protein J5287_13800 [Rhizobium sp. K1/93]QXZ89349.1 hypothetical protein J5280_14790 [Rhizobium sp. K15/93]QYA01937.1 hypothetical protein J5278_01730 [Rhizobium sp. B21/90]
MFHIRNIMTEAWAIYRRETRSSRPSHVEGRRKLFAQCLRTAWTWAKQRIADGKKTMQERAAERVQELTIELMRVDARPWKMRIAGDRQAVLAEIKMLGGVIQ